MEQLHFSANIQAPAQKVWDVLWNDATYPEWTRVFCEGSKAVSDWKEGSSIEFLSGTDGMYSEIDRRIDNQLMSFTHIGMIKDGKRDPAEKSWEGAKEVYRLHENGGHTQLEVELDVIGTHKDYFEKTFPQALAKVKELAEA